MTTATHGVFRSALILLLASPSFAAPDAPDPAVEPVVVRFWTSPWAMEQQYDIVQDFEMLHDGRDGMPPIRIHMGQSAEANLSGDSQRLLCSVAGGDPPDVVFFARHAVGEWAARGAFRSLKPFLDEDSATRGDDEFTLHRDQFFDACWEEASFEGELYAVPLDTDNRALYYNLDYLERYADALIAIGCTDPDDPTKPGPPRTWKQLQQCAEMLSEYDEQGALARVGFIPNYGNSWLYLYGWLKGARFLSEDGRRCTLNSPPIVDALTYMTELYDGMGGANAVYRFQSSMLGGDLDPFLSGKVAMKIDGNWFLPLIASNQRDLRFGVALPPAPEGMPRFGWCGGWSYVMPTGAKHPREAWEFMKYLVSRRACEIQIRAAIQTARAGGRFHTPRIYARKDVTEWVMENHYYNDPTIEPKFKDAMRVFVESMSVSKFRPVTPVGQLLWNEHERAMERGLFKEGAPDDARRSAQLALDRSTAVVQAELDRIYDPPDHPTIAWWPVVAAYAVVLVGGFGVTHWIFNQRVAASGFFRREFRAGYVFASPWFLGFALFGGGPILFSLVMSFCEYDVFHPPRLVGFANYAKMFTGDPLFYKSLGNTLFMALGIPLGMAVGLAIALLLSYEIRGMAVYRTFFYLPAIMPAVAASILWMWIFNPEQGVLNDVLARIGIEGPAWLQDTSWSKPSIILKGLWGAGGGMIVWLAGIKGIPAHLYEAAELDGAGPLRRFWNVTVPMLSPYIFFNLIMGVIGTFQIFAEAYIMTAGGPRDSTLFYAYGLFNNAFRYMRMGYASAMAWVLFAIILALTVLNLRLGQKWVYYESEK
ncbi:MAG: extracellular solute-binding protein [bacterium]|nr:extracellular solute-binding protein [bacterium]